MEFRPADMLGIAVAILIGLLTQIITPYSLPWWLGMWAAAAIVIMVVAHIGLGAVVADYFLIASGMGAVVAVLAFLGWLLLPKATHEISQPYFYFDVELLDPGNLASARPGRVVNNNDLPFHNPTAWFSPSSAKRNPNPRPGPYWLLSDLKPRLPTPLHKGVFWTDKEIPPGDYCVDYNALNSDGKSVGFVERLQIVPYRGYIVVVIDVWSTSNNKLTKLWSSERPQGFSDSPVPWL